MKSYAQHLQEDARCRVLLELDRELNGSLSDLMMKHRLEAWGFDPPNLDWVRTVYTWLERADAVTLVREPTWIATITEAGTAHRRRKLPIAGIRLPERAE